MKQSVYDQVTDRIVAALEAGTVPWERPWTGPEGQPRNLQSGKAYRGINIWLLALQGFESPWWLTFRQAKALGGSVRRGEHGTAIVFYKTVRDEDDPDDRGYTMLKTYTVFNVAQCDGLEVPEPAPRAEVDPVEVAEAIVVGFRDGPAIGHAEQDGAFYTPLLDQIVMPLRRQFLSQAGYYGTLFHELTHSTGHESRLNRDGIARTDAFGSESYSREELIAEMGAAFLSARAGIDPEIDHHAAYLASWIRALRDDRSLVIRAAAAAQKAADLILGEAPAYEAPAPVAELAAA